jgi:hypothetical protein
MSEELTPAELSIIRYKAWSLLEERYAKDPTFGLVKSIDRQLAAMGHTEVKQPAPKQEKFDEGSERIATASIKIFQEVLLKPAFSKEIVPELRKAGVPLPDNEGKATATVSAVYGKRPEIFQKHQGNNIKATSKWHLVPLA